MKKQTLFLSCAFILLITACGNDDDSRVPKVIRITPDPGTRISLREQFTVRFNTPIIPSSGSITYGNSEFGDYTFRLPYSDASDTITWNRCFSAAAGWYGEQIQLIIRDFRDVNDRIQAKAFQVSYNDPPAMIEHQPRRSLPAPAFITDPGFPEMIEHQPSGSRVDPAITREIRVTFDRPIFVEFKTIDPPIDGTPHATKRFVSMSRRCQIFFCRYRTVALCNELSYRIMGIRCGREQVGASNYVHHEAVTVEGRSANQG